MRRHFAQDVKIILVSAEFSKEVTTSVLWLNERGLDIRCVRLRPYVLGERLLLDIQQVLPLPEAEEYQVQIRKKAAEERLSDGGGADWTRYDLTIDGEMFPRQYKRKLFFLVFRTLIQKGITPEQIMEIFPQRKFLIVQGKYNVPAEFAEKASTLLTPNGRSYDLARFFVGSDELIIAGGNSYAISNQWSKEELPDLEKLIAKHSQAAISFAKAAEDNS